MNQIKHRLLNVGEIIQYGDEFLSQFGQGATVWELIYEAHDLIGRKVEHWNSALIRRPMTPAECHAHEFVDALYAARNDLSNCLLHLIGTDGEAGARAGFKRATDAILKMRD